MAEPFFILVLVGALAGATSAFLGWNKSGESFDTRKFIGGLATGIISGLIAAIASSQAITDATTLAAQFIVYLTVFIAIIGIDNMRTAVTGAIRNTRVIEKKEQAK